MGEIGSSVFMCSGGSHLVEQLAQGKQDTSYISVILQNV